MNERRVVPLAAVLGAAILVGCGGGGGGGTPTDMAMPPAADLTVSTGNGQSCFDVVKCYFDQQCVDQACLDACDAKAKNPTYAQHAEEYLGCLGSATGTTSMPGPCATSCNEPGDAGVYDCSVCVLGTCNAQTNTCSGGVCSSKRNTCAADK